MIMRNQESPTPYLQFHCITIKTTIPSAPVKLDSPLEAYSCIGRLAKAYRLPFPEEKPSLQEMMDDIKKAVAPLPSPGEQAERIAEILFAFNRDSAIDDTMRDILEYAYEHEQ